MNDEKSLESGRRRRWYWIAGATVLVVAGTIAVLSLVAGNSSAAGEPSDTETADESAEGEEESTAVPVEVLAVGLGEVASYISATANLVAEEDVTVISEVEGRVTVMRVEEGDHVQSGQVLAVLDSADQEIAVRTSEVRLENTRSAYERATDLYEKELLSREDRDRLRVEFQVAEQDLAVARRQLERTTFRAPFTGRVTSRSVQVGQHVRPGDELFRVTRFDPLIARIHLPESDVLGLAEGRQVRITLNADPGVRFAGRIRQISPVVDTSTGTVKLTIEASDPPDGVRPGSFVAIHVVRESRPGSLLLPRRAVLRELQSHHVFVAQDGVAERRSVALGIEEGEWVEALDGVAAGEQVVIAGQGGLRDGTAIRVLEPEGDGSG